MGEQDLVIQIFSDVSEVNCNFFIEGRSISTTSNAVSEAMKYWRNYKTAIADKDLSPEVCMRLKFAKITSVNIIEITPR